MRITNIQVLLWIIIHSSFLNHLGEGVKNLLGYRKMVFEDYREKHKMVGLLIERKRDVSKNGCALICNANPQCMSFNYQQHGRFCEINSQDIFSNESSSTRDENFVYHGMKQEEEADCFGEDPSLCAGTDKRVNAQWGDWAHVVQIDTSDEWKKEQTRECLPPAHGGTEVCPGPKKVETLEWTKFVHLPGDWETSKSRCEELDGHLFDSLNGTKEQLDFFYDKLDGSSYWLGVWTADHVSWMNMNGEVIPDHLLYWGPYGVNGADKGQTKIAASIYQQKRVYLGDNSPKNWAKAVCDLN